MKTWTLKPDSETRLQSVWRYHRYALSAFLLAAGMVGC